MTRRVLGFPRHHRSPVSSVDPSVQRRTILTSLGSHRQSSCCYRYSGGFCSSPWLRTGSGKENAGERFRLVAASGCRRPWRKHPPGVMQPTYFVTIPYIGIINQLGGITLGKPSCQLGGAGCAETQFSVNAVSSSLKLSVSYKLLLHLHLQRHSYCLCHLTLLCPHVKAQPKEMLEFS